MVSRIENSTGKQLKHWITVLTILLLAFWLRVTGIDDRSLWFDEAVEFISANIPFAQLNEAITSASYQPPLFTLLLHAWLRIGSETIWLRLLPLLLSMFTLLGVMSLGRLFLGRTAGYIAGFIVAVLPVEIYYAQDLSEYSLAICTLSWSLVFLYSAQDRGSWHNWLLWGLFAALSVLSHYGPGIVLFASALVILVENAGNQRIQQLKRQIVVAFSFFVLVAPILWWFLSHQLVRIEQSRAAVQSAVSLGQELARILPAIRDTFSYLLTGSPHSQVPMGIAVTLLIAHGLLNVRFARQTPRLLMWWLGITFVNYYLLVRTGYYGSGFGWRYSQIFTPIFVVVVANGLLMLMDKVSKRLGLVVLLLTMAASLWAFPHPSGLPAAWSRSIWSPTEEMGPVFDQWWQQRQPKDVTYVYYGAQPAFRYYLWLHGDRSQPGSLARQVQTTCLGDFKAKPCNDIDLYFGPWFRQQPMVEKLAAIEMDLGYWPQRLWLVFSHVYRSEDTDIVDALAPYYEVTHHFDDTGAGAYLLQRLPAMNRVHNPVIASELDIRFGESIELAGYNLAPPAAGPGDTIEVTLFWHVLDYVPIRYKVSVAVLGQQINPNGNSLLWGQQDNEPVNWMLPTTFWSPGDIIEDSYVITIDPAAPAATYELLAVMYELSGGARLPVYDADGNKLGDAARLQMIEVE